MELVQLEQLVAIREHGTISGAAGALHISQPALSRSIRRLENDLGQELFERSRNHVRFNEAGEVALRHADAILSNVRLMREEFDELSRRQRTLQVASVAPAPVWRFSELALRRDPSTIIDPHMTSRQGVERALIRREAAFAITLSPIPLPNVLSQQLMTEDLMLFAPTSSAYARRPSVSFSELDGESFIVFEQVGFWMDVVGRNLPHSQIIVQRDRTVFEQLIVATGLLGFSTNAAAATVADAHRTSIPIADADAHATFFLSIMSDAPDEARNIFSWVAGQARE